jgi:hypothetical protein
MKTSVSPMAASALYLAVVVGSTCSVDDTPTARAALPTVTLIEDSESVFRDVIVNVRETHTGSVMFGAEVNADAGLVGLVCNEPASAGDEARSRSGDAEMH